MNEKLGNEYTDGKPKINPTSVRMPQDIHDRIKRRAKKDRRSFNQQAIYLLSLALDQEENQSQDKAA